MKITLDMDRIDFARLNSECLPWGGQGWQDYDLRFWPAGGVGEVNWTYSNAYWFEDAVSMMLARGYLETMGAPYQLLHDEFSDFGWLIVSDYDAYDAGVTAETVAAVSADTGCIRQI